MQWGNTSRHYGVISMTLHWLIALGVIGLIAVGKYMTQDSLDLGTKFQLYQLHKSFGILVLVLMVLRLFWRLMKGAPDYPEHMPGWEKAGAKLSHAGLYALLFVLPLTGWAVVSAATFQIPTLLFNTIPLPHMAEGLLSTFLPAEALNSVIPLPVGTELGQYREFTDANYLDFITKVLHETFGWILIVLIVLHFAAAMKHHVIDKDDVLTRMLPGRRP